MNLIIVIGKLVCDDSSANMYCDKSCSEGDLTACLAATCSLISSNFHKL